jgi:hypothetical protein
VGVGVVVVVVVIDALLLCVCEYIINIFQFYPIHEIYINNNSVII